jgi:hypothetical protein
VGHLRPVRHRRPVPGAQNPTYTSQLRTRSSHTCAAGRLSAGKSAISAITYPAAEIARSASATYDFPPAGKFRSSEVCDGPRGVTSRNRMRVLLERGYCLAHAASSAPRPRAQAPVRSKQALLPPCRNCPRRPFACRADRAAYGAVRDIQHSSDLAVLTTRSEQRRHFPAPVRQFADGLPPGANTPRCQAESVRETWRLPES